MRTRMCNHLQLEVPDLRLSAAHPCTVCVNVTNLRTQLNFGKQIRYACINECVQECHKCKVLKPAGDYYRNRTNNDGLYNNCKACFSQNSQRRQQTLPPMEQRMADAKVPAEVD